MCSLWLSLDNPLTLYRTEMWRLWGKNGSIRAPFSLTVALTSLKALQVRQQSLQRSWASEWCLMRRYKFEAAADLSPEHLSLSLSRVVISVFLLFFFPWTMWSHFHCDWPLTKSRHPEQRLSSNSNYNEAQPACQSFGFLHMPHCECNGESFSQTSENQKKSERVRNGSNFTFISVVTLQFFPTQSGTYCAVEQKTLVFESLNTLSCSLFHLHLIFSHPSV